MKRKQTYCPHCGLARGAHRAECPRFGAEYALAGEVFACRQCGFVHGNGHDENCERKTT